MKFPALKAALAELNAARDSLAKVFAEAGSDMDMDLIGSLSGDSAAKVDWIRAKNTEIDDLKDKVEALRDVERAAENTATDPAPESPEIAPQATKSFGAQFVASNAYKGFGGGTGPQATLDLDIRNVLFQTSAGWAPETTRTGIIDLSPQRALRVLDFVPTLPTTQSAIKFMRETTFTDSAVVEKAEGVTYGEAELALTEQTQPVEKIPVWLPITDEQLEDVAGVEAYVDGRLIYMIRKRLDGQILTGTGVAPLLLGTENVSGIQTQALGGDPIPDAIYKAMVAISDDYDGGGGDGDPSVVFIRATKWQTVRLLRTADGIYIWGNPSDAGPMRIWGVPVVETNAVTATKAVLGDYTAHSVLYVRRGVDVQVSNSHGSFFVEGKQAIRADLRVSMVHIRPKAFAEVTGL